MRSCEVSRTVPPDGCVDVADMVKRLEEAGATLLALPGSGHSPRLSQGGLDVVRSAIEAYGWSEAPVKPAVPSAHAITRMDEALTWLGLIPQDRYVLRRVVGARMLVHPLTDRHLFTWRRIGCVLGADYRAIQRWHGEAIDLIAAALRAKNYFR